jgi:hypothetical protein
MDKCKLIKLLEDAYENGLGEGEGCGKYGSTVFDFNDWLNDNKDVINKLCEGNCAIPVVSESKMPRTVFIDGESVEEMHSINTLIRFTKGEGVRLNDILYVVESIDIDLDNNIIYVWLDTIK